MYEDKKSRPIAFAVCTNIASLIPATTWQCTYVLDTITGGCFVAYGLYKRSRKASHMHVASCMHIYVHICVYSLGGPLTVTDANLCLGRLIPR